MSVSGFICILLHFGLGLFVLGSHNNLSAGHAHTVTVCGSFVQMDRLNSSSDGGYLVMECGVAL